MLLVVEKIRFRLTGDITMPDEVKLYGNILDNISDGVSFLDSRKKITYWNKGAERITGYSASEMVGSFCSDNILVHIDENGTCLCTKNCPVTKTLSDGNVRNVDVYLHHKDGYRIPVSVHVSPIKESDDKVIGAIEIFRDKSNEILDIQFIDDLKKAALLDPLTELANRRNIEMGNLFQPLS